MTAKMVSAYLTADDFQHTLLGEDEDVIETGMGGLDNIDHLELYLFFDEDGNYVHIRTKEYVKIPENLKEKIYPVINELNLNFRWCTFVINTDNELIVKMDAILDMDTCGEECKELIYRTVGICDEAYPTIMKALWAQLNLIEKKDPRGRDFVGKLSFLGLLLLQ